MADLKIKIKGDASPLNRALSSSKRSLSSFARISSSIFAGIGAGIGIAIAALSKIKTTIDPIASRLDDIGKASKRIGITTNEFQELAFAARRTGVSTETVEKSFKRMQKVIFDAKKGLSTSRDALNALGLSYQDLENKSPLEQFEMIARRLALVEDVTLKNAVAQDVFGRSGMAISPMISQYDKLKQELKDINGIMSEEAIKSAEDYKDAIENLSTSFDALIAASGIIDNMAEGFRNIEAAITSIRRSGLGDFFENLQTQAFDKDRLRDLSIGGIAGYTGGTIGSAIRTTGSFERLDRQRQQLLRDIQNRGKGDALKAEVNEAIKNFDPKKKGTSNATGLQMLQGGGTLSALGGDISGGGFVSRVNIQERQLSVLEQIRDGVIKVGDANFEQALFNEVTGYASQTRRAIRD